MSAHTIVFYFSVTGHYCGDDKEELSENEDCRQDILEEKFDSIILCLNKVIY